MNKPYDRPLRGDRQCQCSACYEYFTTVSGFDKHRYGPWAVRKCLTTAELKAKGWSLTERGFWRQPNRHAGPVHARQGAAIS